MMMNYNRFILDQQEIVEIIFQMVLSTDHKNGRHPHSASRFAYFNFIELLCMANDLSG